MFKHYFEQIHNIEVFPLISLFIFFLFFLGLLVWVIKADKTYIQSMQDLPLSNEEAQEEHQIL
jgi:hypothetical protein